MTFYTQKIKVKEGDNEVYKTAAVIADGRGEAARRVISLCDGLGDRYLGQVGGLQAEFGLILDDTE